MFPYNRVKNVPGSLIGCLWVILPLFGCFSRGKKLIAIKAIIGNQHQLLIKNMIVSLCSTKNQNYYQEQLIFNI
jgi:hypothetical protein